MKTDSIIEDLYALKESFDFSDLNKEPKLFNNDNKKVVGKIKLKLRKLFG